MLEYSAIVLLSIVMGGSFVGFLTAHPLKMSRYLAAALLAFMLVVVIFITRLQGTQLWIAAGLAVLGFMTGYLAMARHVLAREDETPAPQLTRRPEDPGLGHTAVVYFTHGEPETFDAIGWLNQFREFDEQKIPFVPFVARPFFIYGLRKKYLAVGRSEHRSIHIQMIRSLENAYRQQGDHSTCFYLSFLDDNPRPHAALIQALNEGASKIVVCEVFLTDSNHTAEGKNQIKAVLEGFPNLPVRYTGPMHDSLMLQSLFVQRAKASSNGVDPSKIGILLVGHGQPDEWDVEWPTETEQEIGFRMGVLKTFEANGYQPENISLAWMEFKEPKPAAKIEAFIQNGVEEILYFPAAISADSIHSQYDIPELVHQARIPAHVTVKNLGAWNDDPLVIRALKEKIDRAMQSL